MAGASGDTTLIGTTTNDNLVGGWAMTRLAAGLAATG